MGVSAIKTANPRVFFYSTMKVYISLVRMREWTFFKYIFEVIEISTFDKRTGITLFVII